ncbi:hypothetical protein EXIGLDRAFT_837902 [Exidia glandulosa HHB12029]|uniref:Probable RNA polymerase II nuclear localization protein SLC7A6OS n=1 Tax=Exidia glandulosa HHB12029 TaxID=1314781 RepID=A0A165GC69_EXIGL|nr:hypothetical protein EXIGLDRAFT_837902 [Exidia glandulosa HHB12029]
MAESMDVDSITTMDVEVKQTTTSTGITLLRVKRKLTETHLDALVIDQIKRKRSRGPGDSVFTYAATLEEGADLQTIQEEITSFSTLQLPDRVPTRPATPVDPDGAVNPPETTRIIAPRPSRKFTVIHKKANEDSATRAAAVDAQPSSQMTVYDAVADDAPLDAEDAPDELKSFLPMLENYLKAHATDSLHDRPADAGDVPGYVYDIYIHRPGQPLQSATTYTNVGSVSGLPGAFDDAWDSDDDEYAGDTEDEDSNAEDFYQNDYPDERSDDSASDEFRMSDGEGSYIEDPEDYATYDHDEDDGPRLRVRN